MAEMLEASCITSIRGQETGIPRHNVVTRREPGGADFGYQFVEEVRLYTLSFVTNLILYQRPEPLQPVHRWTCSVYLGEHCLSGDVQGSIPRD